MVARNYREFGKGQGNASYEKTGLAVGSPPKMISVVAAIGYVGFLREAAVPSAVLCDPCGAFRIEEPCSGL